MDSDISLWGISDSAPALAALFRSSLTLRSVDKRIYVLAPVRSFMLVNRCPSEADAAPIFAHYFTLAQLAEQFVHSPTASSDVLAVIASELANIEAIVRHVLSNCRTGRGAALQAVLSLCRLYTHCGMGSGVELLPTAIQAAKELNLEESRADLLMMWARISADLTIPGNPRALLAEARDIYERLGDEDGVVDCRIRMMDYLPPTDGVVECQKLYDMLLPQGDSLLLARCVSALGDCVRHDGKLRAAIAYYETAIGIMHRVFGADVQHKVVGLCRYHMGSNLIHLCDFRSAIAQLQEALSLFDATSYGPGSQAVRLLLGDIFSVVGQPQQAVRQAEEVLAMDIPGAGSFRIYAQCLVTCAFSHVQAGNPDAVEAALDRVDRLALARETIPIVHCQSLTIRCHLALQRGDIVEARIALNVARTIARKGFCVPREIRSAWRADIHCLTSLSEVECAAGRRDEAASLIICASIAFRSGGDVMNSARCLPRLAEAVEDEFAESIIDAGLLPMQWMGLSHELAILLLRSATIARNRGQHELARNRARNALRRFGEIKGDWRLSLTREIAGVAHQ